MMRFIMPIILIVLSVSVFFVFTNPLYNDILQLRTQVASYNDALNNSKSLESERDKLTAKYNAINPDDLAKLQKLLPDNIDNIRLILELGKVASPYNMVLKDVKYNPTASTAAATAAAAANTVQGAGSTSDAVNQTYGTWDLEFSTEGTYDNFINFTKDLESNLRIVDISSISFASDNTTAIPTKVGAPVADTYKYDFKIKTYWLKN